VKLEHHIAINLDVHIENGRSRKSVFVNSKMRQSCRLGQMQQSIFGFLFSFLVFEEINIACLKE
jgi:hypothetical protein